MACHVVPGRCAGCACCADAPSRWLCPACEADPANAGWALPDEGEDLGQVPDDRGLADAQYDAPRWVPTELQCRVLRYLFRGASLRGAAKLAPCSESFVKKTLKQYKAQANL